MSDIGPQQDHCRCVTEQRLDGHPSLERVTVSRIGISPVDDDLFKLPGSDPFVLLLPIGHDLEFFNLQDAILARWRSAPGWPGPIGPAAEEA
jgi:hypothetical protein